MKTPRSMKKQPISAFLQCLLANQSKSANTTAKATTPSHLRVTPNQLLLRKLEELGIGRPSTFASIIQTIQDRGYVYKRGRALVPTFLAFSVTGLLETHFTKLVDYDFTASMEEDLDKIAAGEAGRVDWLRDFYYGVDGQPGLDELSLDLGGIDARATNTMNLSDTIEIRVGRYGAYLQENIPDQDRKLANIPEELAPDELTLAKAIELLAAPSGERELGTDPQHRPWKSSQNQDALVLTSPRYFQKHPSN
jgi:DNA topoisomerase I